VKRDTATCGPLRKHPVGNAGMRMHMLVQRRAEAVLERDRTKPRAGLSRPVTIGWHTCRIAKQQLSESGGQVRCGIIVYSRPDR
jgi:hypothetical protein